MYNLISSVCVFGCVVTLLWLAIGSRAFINGFGLGFAVRTHAGVAPLPGSVGSYFWGGIAGTTFWVDPARELFAAMLVQAPPQRNEYRALFRTMVYAALDD